MQNNTCFLLILPCYEKNVITFFFPVSPKAKASCSENGESFSCFCEGIGGNPPPWASWVKDNTKIKGPGYLTFTLVKDDMEKGGEGIYYCEALSGNIKDVVRRFLCVSIEYFFITTVANFVLQNFQILWWCLP